MNQFYHDLEIPIDRKILQPNSVVTLKDIDISNFNHVDILEGPITLIENLNKLGSFRMGFIGAEAATIVNRNQNNQKTWAQFNLEDVLTLTILRTVIATTNTAVNTYRMILSPNDAPINMCMKAILHNSRVGNTVGAGAARAAAKNNNTAVLNNNAFKGGTLPIWTTAGTTLCNSCWFDMSFAISNLPGVIAEIELTKNYLDIPERFEIIFSVINATFSTAGNAPTNPATTTILIRRLA